MGLHTTWSHRNRENACKVHITEFQFALDVHDSFFFCILFIYWTQTHTFCIIISSVNILTVCYWHPFSYFCSYALLEGISGRQNSLMKLGGISNHHTCWRPLFLTPSYWSLVQCNNSYSMTEPVVFWCMCHCRQTLITNTNSWKKLNDVSWASVTRPISPSLPHTAETASLHFLKHFIIFKF